MNALKILSRGHQNLVDVLKDLPERSWNEGFVTGSWTVKDVVDHLGTYELMQVEAFEKFVNTSAPTPLHDQKTKRSFLEFNKEQWEKGKDKTWQEILSRYSDAHAKLKQLVETTAPELMAKPDTTSWYGEACSLDDVIAFNYGHKKHHVAQIKLFRQRNNI